MSTFKDRVALVTGAGSGIGRAVALALADQGARVVITGRRSEPLERVAAAHENMIGLVADVAEPNDAANSVAKAVKTWGRLDILVNNAGIIRRADAVDFTEEDWDAVIDTNLKTAFFLSQAAGRHMLEQGSGKIINIASLLSFQGGIRIPSYTASKSGLAGITKLLACEWAGRGVNVNAIAPGYFSTNNTTALREDPDRSAAILARIPAGRWGTPAELGGAAVFLASAASDYVHGTVIPVDGGWLAR